MNAMTVKELISHGLYMEKVISVRAIKVITRIAGRRLDARPNEKWSDWAARARAQKATDVFEGWTPEILMEERNCGAKTAGEIARLLQECGVPSRNGYVTDPEVALAMSEWC